LAVSRMVSCPQCGKSAPFSSANPFRPFCSERCKLIDMGAWANEDYRAEVRNEGGRTKDEGQLET
jgi:hypothetical protein